MLWSVGRDRKKEVIRWTQPENPVANFPRLSLDSDWLYKRPRDPWTHRQCTGYGCNIVFSRVFLCSFIPQPGPFQRDTYTPPNKGIFPHLPPAAGLRQNPFMVTATLLFSSNLRVHDPHGVEPHAIGLLNLRASERVVGPLDPPRLLHNWGCMGKRGPGPLKFAFGLKVWDSSVVLRRGSGYSRFPDRRSGVGIALLRLLQVSIGSFH